MKIMCPTCGITEKLVSQWKQGVNTPGSLIVLKCGHAFELIPRTEFDE